MNQNQNLNSAQPPLIVSFRILEPEMPNVVAEILGNNQQENPGGGQLKQHSADVHIPDQIEVKEHRDRKLVPPYRVSDQLFEECFVW